MEDVIITFIERAHFDRECMDWIIAKKIKVLAADTPCYDDIQDESDSKNLRF